MMLNFKIITISICDLVMGNGVISIAQMQLRIAIIQF